MPFWVYKVPVEERDAVASKLKEYVKPSLEIDVPTPPGSYSYPTWKVRITGMTRMISPNLIFIEFEDLRWHGLATFEFNLEDGTFEITDSDFPYPLEFIILREFMKIDTSRWTLIKEG